jgi:hypothetical protein
MFCLFHDALSADNSVELRYKMAAEKSEYLVIGSRCLRVVNLRESNPKPQDAGVSIWHFFFCGEGPRS